MSTLHAFRRASELGVEFPELEGEVPVFEDHKGVLHLRRVCFMHQSFGRQSVKAMTERGAVTLKDLDLTRSCASCTDSTVDQLVKEDVRTDVRVLAKAAHALETAREEGSRGTLGPLSVLARLEKLRAPLGTARSVRGDAARRVLLEQVEEMVQEAQRWSAREETRRTSVEMVAREVVGLRALRSTNGRNHQVPLPPEELTELVKDPFWTSKALFSTWKKRSGLGWSREKVRSALMLELEHRDPSAEAAEAVDALLTQWEGLTREVLTEDEPTVMVMAAALPDARIAQALLLSTTLVTRGEKRLMAVPRFAVEWVRMQGGWKRSIASVGPLRDSEAVLETALTLWEPGYHAESEEFENTLEMARALEA